MFELKENQIKRQKIRKTFVLEGLNKPSNYNIFPKIVKENCSFHLSILAWLTQIYRGVVGVVNPWSQDK